MERTTSEKKPNYRAIKCWLKKRDTVVTNSAKVESAKKKCLVALENTLAMLVYAVHSDSLKWARLSTKRQVLLWLFSWGESINRSGKIHVNKSFKHPSEIASIWSINQSNMQSGTKYLTNNHLIHPSDLKKTGTHARRRKY